MTIIYVYIIKTLFKYHKAVEYLLKLENIKRKNQLISMLKVLIHPLFMEWFITFSIPLLGFCPRILE